jgi:hypothetical protein
MSMKNVSLLVLAVILLSVVTVMAQDTITNKQPVSLSKAQIAANQTQQTTTDSTQVQKPATCDGTGRGYGDGTKPRPQDGTGFGAKSGNRKYRNASKGKGRRCGLRNGSGRRQRQRRRNCCAVQNSNQQNQCQYDCKSGTKNVQPTGK